MRVLHVYTAHRGGGGAENAIAATIAVSRRNGLQVDTFERHSSELPPNILGRVRAGVSAMTGAAVDDFAAKLEGFQPHIVHIHDLFPLISPRIVPLCRAHGIPVVMSIVHYRLTCPVVTHYRDGHVCTECLGGREHRAVINNCRQNLPESVTVALYNAFETRVEPLHKHVSCFFCPSEFTQRWLIDNAGIDERRTRLVTPLVDVPASAADAGLGTYVGFGGRFVPEKGFETMFEAARRTGLPFRLSRNEKYPVNVAIPAGIEQVVTSSRQELHEFYRGARLMVFPSTWNETFGMSGAEAMSHGIPLIASRIGALPELIHEGQDGLLFEAGNAAQLAQQVQQLWNDPELCRRMGRAARQKTMRWGPREHFEQLVSAYEDLLGVRSARRGVAAAG